MKSNKLPYKKTGIAVLSAFLLFVSLNATAQKGVYDVIPGSGPKKTNSSGSLPEIIKGDTRNDGRKNERRNVTPVCTASKKRNLPPGQAKKVYGGSATDYAPGQVKKRKGDDGHRGEAHGENHGKRLAANR